MISEDTHNKLIALGLHKDAFNNYFYKNHPKSFIFTFEDMCVCTYDFTLKKNSKSENLKMTLNPLCGLNLFTAFTSCFATYVLF